LGNNLEDFAFKNIERMFYEKHEILKQLTQLQKQKIFDKSIIKRASRDEIIFNKGEKCNSIIIPMEANLVWV